MSHLKTQKQMKRKSSLTSSKCRKQSAVWEAPDSWWAHEDVSHLSSTKPLSRFLPTTPKETCESWWADEMLSQLPRRHSWAGVDDDAVDPEMGTVWKGIATANLKKTSNPTKLQKTKKPYKPDVLWIITNHHAGRALSPRKPSSLTPMAVENGHGSSVFNFKSIHFDDFDTLWDSIEVDVSGITPVPPSATT